MTIKRVPLPDGSTWPLEVRSGGDDSLSWRLRHAPGTLDYDDAIAAAELLDAYRSLAFASTTKRRLVLNALRAAIEAP
jgi:hypothetical protein